MKKQKNRATEIDLISVVKAVPTYQWTKRQTEPHVTTEMQTERRIDRQTYRHISDRQIYREKTHKGRQTDFRQTYIQTYKKTYRKLCKSI